MKRWQSLAASAIVASGLMLATWVPSASAALPPTHPPDCSQMPDGRCLWLGYFTNEQLQYYDSTYPGPGTGFAGDRDMFPELYNYSDLGQTANWAIPQYVNSGASFVAFIGSYLNTPDAACPINMPDPPADWPANDGTIPYQVGTCWTYRMEVQGAAFMVLTMMGGKYVTNPGGVFTGPNNITTGIADAQSEFAAWSTEVLAADAAGDVNWNMLYSDLGAHADSHSLDFGHDVDVYPVGSQLDLRVIEFHNPTGTYVINKACGNVEGGFAALASADTNIQAGLGGIRDSGGLPAATLVRGKSYTIYPSVINSGPGPSSTVYLELKQPTGITLTSVDAADNPYGVSSGVSPGGCVAGYARVTVASSPPSACAGPHAVWQYDNIGAHSAVMGQTSTFTVNANATGNICFQSDATPQSLTSLASFSTSAVVCLMVATISHPSAVGANGDIHAGGGTCNTNQSAAAAGYVQGNPSGGSGDQYVVSATAGISNFASDNLVAPGNDLSLGTNGGYSEVCRADLEAAALKYYNLGVGFALLSSSSPHDLATLNPADSVFFSIDGGKLSIYGNVARKMTIVALNGGTIDISQNIQITAGPTVAAATPSLGLIADGGISIDSNVSRVDAYMFSDAGIDTCAQFAQVPNPCTTNLLVNGFLMASGIAFHRVGPKNATGSPVAEDVVLNPQIYLNPPMFFDSSVDGDVLQGLGENQPLF